MNGPSYASHRSIADMTARAERAAEHVAEHVTADHNRRRPRHIFFYSDVLERTMNAETVPWPTVTLHYNWAVQGAFHARKGSDSSQRPTNSPVNYARISPWELAKNRSGARQWLTRAICNGSSTFSMISRCLLTSSKRGAHFDRNDGLTSVTLAP